VNKHQHLLTNTIEFLDIPRWARDPRVRYEMEEDARYFITGWWHGDYLQRVWPPPALSGNP